MSQSNPIEHEITNMEAARRQLATAIELWFNDGDFVSIHTLAAASHEVIDSITKKDRSHKLLFDNPTCKEEHRNKFNDWLRKPANFFKHGGWERRLGTKISFSPSLSEMFILYSILGLQYTQHTLNDTEQAYMFWFIYHKPQFLSPQGHKMFIESIPVKDLDSIRWLPKHEFFKMFINANLKARAS